MRSVAALTLEPKSAAGSVGCWGAAAASLTGSSRGTLAAAVAAA